jgi:tripartite motif-containing protein 71
MSWNNGVAVSVDGATLLVSNSGFGKGTTVHEFIVADGSGGRVVGGSGCGPLQFDFPGQVCIAPDGLVFVADSWNRRVQVLTPTLDFHGYVGESSLVRPSGVCANADVVVVSESVNRRVSVFERRDGARVRGFASAGSGDGQLAFPGALCFVAGDRHVAIVDCDNHRVSVFSVDGDFIRHVGVGLLKGPKGVAASAFDELVVADTGNECLRVFNDTGDLLATMGEGYFTGVALRGSTVFATDAHAHTVSVLA